MRPHNRQAIVIKNLVDQAREQHEMVKFSFYNIDNSEGARLLIEGTNKRGFFRARYLNPDALATRNALFKENT
jgi:hypothetical protein